MRKKNQLAFNMVCIRKGTSVQMFATALKDIVYVDEHVCSI